MQEEVDLRECLKIILKRKKIIISGTLICVILATVVSLLLPRTYRSSLILEVGRFYLSSDRWKQEMLFVEPPLSTAKVIGSEGVLDQVRKRLKLDLRLREMKKRLAVITFREDQEYSPVLEIAYEGRTPREAVEVLNVLAGIIINRHAEEYKSYQSSLNERIKYTREKIAATEKIIAAQVQYRDLSQKYIEKGEISEEEFSREMGKLEEAQPSPVDVLFLKSSSLTEKQHIANLNSFKAQMDMAIGENQKQIAAADIAIIDLQSQIDLSSPTEIRAPAVLPERHFRPKRSLIIIVGGILGLALSTLFAFYREYLT